MLVGAWSLGVVLLAARMIGGWALAQRLARSGQPTTLPGLERALARLCEVMRVARPVRLLESVRVEVPTVIGWMRPVILFPAATLAGLTPAQLEVVLAHELAHVRRLDYLVNLLQTAIETLLFYHPAVWWVSSRVRVEREHCCDDAAVAACGDALAYARALTDLEGLRVGPVGLAVAADGGSLLHRVARLVGPASHAPRASRAVGALLALVILPAFLAGSGWIDARAQSEPDPASVGAAPPASEEPADPDAEAAEEQEATAKPPEAGTAARKTARTNAALEIEQVVELARAGVTPEYLDEMAEAGYRSLTWPQVIELRSQGVDAEFVKGLREEGLTKLSISELLELRSQGVGPEFVKDLKAEGYAELSPTSLINLRNQGVSAEYIRELKSLGYSGLSTTKLIALRNQGVDPEYIRAMKDAGYADLSVPLLIGLRNQGVTPEYVRELKELGYGGLATGLLIELRNQGVSAEFIREVKEAGYANVTPADLVELRSQGVTGSLLRRLRGQPRTARP
jgi:hypothetical protein